MNQMDVVEIEATMDPVMVFDEKGFFVIFLRDGEIVAEHYQNVTHSSETVKTGKLDTMVVGASALAMCHTIVREDLISRLDIDRKIVQLAQVLDFGKLLLDLCRLERVAHLREGLRLLHVGFFGRYL